MILSEQVKNKIIEILDSDEFMNNLYVDGNGKPLDEETRTKLGQFYTPGKICIQMIEKFNFDSLAGKNILDPTVGSGNLLIACLIAGADSDKIFGNEYDDKVIPTCRHRIRRALELLGKEDKFNDWQIHQGNALQKRCLVEFSEEYSGKRDSNGHMLPRYNPEYIDDLEYAQSDYGWRTENEKAKARIDKIKLAEEMKAQAYNSLF